MSFVRRSVRSTARTMMRLCVSKPRKDEYSGVNVGITSKIDTNTVSASKTNHVRR